MNRTRRVDPKTFRFGFPRYLTLFGSVDGSESCETQPNCGTIFTIATAPLSSLSQCLRVVALFWLFAWLFVNLMMREQTLITSFAARFCFAKLTLGWMPIFTRRSRASTFQIISARLSKNGTMVSFLPWWIFLFFDTLRPRDKDGSESVAALWSGFCARSLLSCRELHWSPFDRWPSSFHL